jgi:carboxypeptidase Taq
MLHQEWTSEELRSALEQAALEIDPSSEDAATVRVLQREISIHSKLPADLVEAKAKVSSDAYEKWRQARAQSDFNLLSPYLERLFDIARETANLLGHTDHIYDPLVDLFEEGATYEQAKAMFDAMKGPIRELVELAPSVDTSFLYGEWNTETLVSFAGRMARQIGFDFDKGRLDPTTNAFCSNMSSADVRMTTRPARHFGGILFSTLHEMGHGLYEQGSPSEWDRTPLAGGISLGVHESQSRTWENIVGLTVFGDSSIRNYRRPFLLSQPWIWQRSIRRLTKLSRAPSGLALTNSPTTYTSWFASSWNAKSLRMK